MVALDAVARATQHLQIVDVIGAALGDGDDVVDFEVAFLEVRAAAGAVATLLAVEPVAVGGAVVGRERAEVGAAGGVGAMHDVAEQSSPWRSSRRDAISSAALGDMSMPTHDRPRSSTATNAVAQPQNGSNTTSLGLLEALTMRCSAEPRRSLLAGVRLSVDTPPAPR